MKALTPACKKDEEWRVMCWLGYLAIAVLCKQWLIVATEVLWLLFISVDSLKRKSVRILCCRNLKLQLYVPWARSDRHWSFLRLRTGLWRCDSSTCSAMEGRTRFFQPVAGGAACPACLSGSLCLSPCWCTTQSVLLIPPQVPGVILGVSWIRDNTWAALVLRSCTCGIWITVK